MGMCTIMLKKLFDIPKAKTLLSVRAHDKLKPYQIENAYYVVLNITFLTIIFYLTVVLKYRKFPTLCVQHGGSRCDGVSEKLLISLFRFEVQSVLHILALQNILNKCMSNHRTKRTHQAV
ncbi:hypothetical protein HHI36_007404 [Cryptolaemus montrouzieri]|uniref:Uncharacterized protein n=1 Tax=Cryptolaemus montrouzieri TaxID=559131 RepID=A0ABD2MPP6_9CUCU